MYDNSAKVFWISFLTSFFVSLVVVLVMIIFVVPNLNFLNIQEEESYKVEVPQLEGMNVERAKIIAMNKNLAMFVESERISDNVPKGSIITQSPLPGAEVDKNTVINVIVSAGPKIEEPVETPKQQTIKKVIIPHYAGLNIDDVQRNIIALNLKIGVIKYIESDKYPADAVIKTEPASGLEVAEGSVVNIYVSKGIGDVTVPNVYKLSKSAAIRKIENAGLHVSQTHYTVNIEYPFDIVIKQYPSPGSKVKKGSGIEIWINTEAR